MTFAFIDISSTKNVGPVLVRKLCRLTPLVFLVTACSTTTVNDSVPTRSTLAQEISASISPSTTSKISPSYETAFPATTSTSTPTIRPTTSVYEGWWDPASVGQPWGSKVEGILTFRGSPTRSWYGRGPVPLMPEVLWRFPEEGRLCSLSTTGGRTTNWCGIGWTGQPAVWERVSLQSPRRPRSRRLHLRRRDQPLAFHRGRTGTREHPPPLPGAGRSVALSNRCQQRRDPAQPTLDRRTRRQRIRGLRSRALARHQGSQPQFSGGKARSLRGRIRNHTAPDHR